MCLFFGEYEGGHVLSVYLFERKYDGAMARLYRNERRMCHLAPRRSSRISAGRACSQLDDISNPSDGPAVSACCCACCVGRQPEVF